MTLSFSCPSCGLMGRVDESFAGRQVRCKQCQYRFEIPSGERPESEGYDLDGPTPKVSLDRSESDNQGSVYAAARGDEPVGDRGSTLKRPTGRTVRKKRRAQESEIDWKRWLIRGGAVGSIGLILVALIVPKGLVLSGLVLIVLGMLMMLVGYGAGLVGAFSEDLLYGFLYLLFPLYTAYYLVTRWDDLWRWAICSTAGFGLIVLGSQMLRWAGVEG